MAYLPNFIYQRQLWPIRGTHLWYTDLTLATLKNRIANSARGIWQFLPPTFTCPCMHQSSVIRTLGKIEEMRMEGRKGAEVWMIMMVVAGKKTMTMGKHS